MEARARSLSSSVSLKMASSFTAAKCEIPLQHAAAAGQRPQHEHRPRLVPLQSPQSRPDTPKGGERGLGARAMRQNSLFKTHNVLSPDLFLFSSTRPF